MSVIYLFPGQNSYHPNLLHRLVAATPLTARILQNASEILGRDLDAHFRPQNEAMFDHARDVQVGGFLASYMLARLLELEGVFADASIGFSLGEYNHLVEIGALGFADALKIVDARGAAHDEGPSGLMLLVQPCEDSSISKALTQARALGPVDIAIRLSKNRFVLAGATGAVQLAGVWLEKQARAKTEVFDHRRPLHSPMFRPAAERFLPVLERSAWQAPMTEYLSTTEGQFCTPASSRELIQMLFRHEFRPLQWARSIRLLLERFPAAVCVEVGPCSPVTDIFKLENSHIPCLRMDDPEDGTAVFKATIDRLRARFNAA
jgi:[acyl-carrier-protein] S-malonyltransferase